MPWQSVPPMIIIGVAFNVIAGAMYGIDKVAYGKPREIERDEWKWAHENRDLRVEEFRRLMKESAKAQSS
eukprot:CAMPEP_0198303338 /NCGR_PEP_ID=MMETSP1449-20131203/56834_1 /TAXON_ID=420275 /ORGANISM="Attheya septentrionalis, Strain CCMP2084" /LENGTH=69 /DNA_ID=CAMNT_0044005825 /DNA_START=574 /DNA_END=783 /DNA_ORIENTATION=+